MSDKQPIGERIVEWVFTAILVVVFILGMLALLPWEVIL